MSLNQSSPWNDVTQLLFQWGSANRISNKAMTEVMRIVADARNFPEANLDYQWRTVLKHKNKHELKVLRTMLQSSAKAKTSSSTDVFVCSACAITKFSQEDVDSAPQCPTCNVAWVSCSFKFCGVQCVCTSRLGNSSLTSLVSCLNCGISVNSSYTARCYVLDLERSLQTLFLNERAARNALAPWQVDGRTFFSEDTTSNRVSPNNNWVHDWRHHVRSLPYKSEAWHGESFLSHPIWEQHGIRSLLLVLHLDWFEPFKQKAYSVGLLSVGILNFTCHERARTGAIWPVMILSGPKQLPSTYACMSGFLETINEFATNGIQVFDVLTQSRITVHVAVAQIVADRPAAAKIGEYKHHSAFMGCHRCYFRAGICGCKSNADDNDDSPITFDNFNFDPQTMVETDRVLLTGERRNMRRGEHMVWLEADQISEEMLVDDSDRLENQLEIHSNTNNPPANWSKTFYLNWVSEQRNNGLSPLCHIDNFSITRDIVIDAMHLFHKGVALRLAKLTLGDFAEYKKNSWNLHSNKVNVNKFQQRLALFQLPSNFERHIDIASNVSGVKAAALLNFLKIQALLALENLVPGDVWEIWHTLIQLTCGLLHTHVPKIWVNENGISILIRKLITSFQQKFGVCHMSPNWHLLLHLVTDFKWWSALRTHWAFASERLNHEIVASIQSGSLAHIDATIASNSLKYSTLTSLSESFRLADESSESFPEHGFTSAYDNVTPEIGKFLQKGYRLTKMGRLIGIGGKCLKCALGDILWLFDPNSTTSTAASEFNLYQINGIAKSSSKNEFAIAVSQLVGVSPRPGYSNTFNWAVDNITQRRQPVKVIETNCNLCCEHVAVYRESGFKPVLIPCCGNLPY